MAHLLSSGPFGEESELSAGQWLRSFNNRNLLPLQSYLKVVGAAILMSWSSHFLFLYFSCFLNLLKRYRKPNLDFGVANFNCQSAPQHCLLIVNPLHPPPPKHIQEVCPLQQQYKISEIIYTSQGVSLTQISQARPWPKSIFY